MRARGARTVNDALCRRRALRHQKLGGAARTLGVCALGVVVSLHEHKDLLHVLERDPDRLVGREQRARRVHDAGRHVRTREGLLATVFADCLLVPLQRDHREPFEPLAALTNVDLERVVAHADSDLHGGGTTEVLCNAAGACAARAARPFPRSGNNSWGCYPNSGQLD